MRVMELAGELVKSGELEVVDFADITCDQVLGATEVLVLGTTPNVTRVSEFDGKMIGGGQQGPVFEKLSALLLDDIRNNEKILTPVFNA